MEQQLSWLGGDVDVRTVSTDPRVCGESPVVLSDGHTLAEVDIVGQFVALTDLANLTAGEVIRLTFDAQTGGVADVPTTFRSRGVADHLLGTLIVAAGSVVYSVNRNGGQPQRRIDLNLPPTQQLNELVLDEGRGFDPIVWLASKSNAKRNGARLPEAGIFSWNLATDKVVRVFGGLGNGNGIAVHPTERKLRWADTAAKRVWDAEILPDGTLGQETLVYQYSCSGSPDGGVFLPNGGYLQAIFRDGVLAYFHPGFDPEVEAPVLLPVPMSQPTKPALGRRGEIILTSANEGLKGDALAADPQAGDTVLLTGSGVDEIWG